jgi:NUMOD4 motif/HNH endonuclease
MEEERWKPVIGYEDFYEVSDLGRVKGLARMIEDSGGRLRRIREKILKPTPVGNQALIVVLCRDGEKSLRRVHHLVLEAFIGPCPLGMVGQHFPDKDVNNNRPSNLKWVHKVEVMPHGEEHYAATLTENNVRDILNNSGNAALARKFQTRRGHIWLIKNRHRWKHINPHSSTKTHPKE